MDPRKAPIIDGLSGMLYKEIWDIVGKDVFQFCHEILNGRRNIVDINDTIVILIPKIQDPKNMTHFFPISLCRVIFKMLSKVLANRLKGLLPAYISQNQSAFVLRLRIHNNILVTYELMYYLHRFKNGPNMSCH